MGIAAFVCLTLSYAVLESFEAKNYLSEAIKERNLPRLVTIATTITKGYYRELQSQRRLQEHIRSKMSADQERDKSKLHKLKLKGTRSATAF